MISLFYPFGPKQEKDTTKQIGQLKSQLPNGLLPNAEAECGKPQDGMVPRPRDGGCEAWRIGGRRRWLLEQERVLHFEDHLAEAVTFRSWFSQPTEIQGGTGREKMPQSPLSSAPDFQQLLPIGHAKQEQVGKESLGESEGSAILFNNGSDSICYRFFGPKDFSQFCCLRIESSHGQKYIDETLPTDTEMLVSSHFHVSYNILL